MRANEAERGKKLIASSLILDALNELLSLDFLFLFSLFRCCFSQENVGKPG